jgi:hypothetical protein
VLRNRNVDPRAEPEAEPRIGGIDRLVSEPERQYKRLIERSREAIDRPRCAAMKFLHDEGEPAWPTLFARHILFCHQKGAK